MKKVIVGKGENAVQISYVQPDVMDANFSQAFRKFQQGGQPLKLYKVSRSSGLIEAALNASLSGETDRAIFLSDIDRQTHLVVSSWHPDAIKLRWFNPILHAIVKAA